LSLYEFELLSFWYHFFLTGFSYSQLNESDVLLLDISDNNEYVWTNDFVPSQSPTPTPTLAPSSPLTTLNNPQNSDNKSTVVIAAVVGS